MECQKCNVKITPTNWSRYIRSLKHLKNDTDQAIPPRSRRRPKTKPNTGQIIKSRKPKTKPVNNITRKEMLSQTGDCNIKAIPNRTKNNYSLLQVKQRKCSIRNTIYNTLLKTN